MHTPLEHSAISDGDSLSIGGLYWPRPYFPTRWERATLIGSVIPPWAIPTSNTAGWIWTGMGLPTPLAVLRPSTPALSPLQRERWRAREVRDSRHTVVSVAGFPVLDPLSTENELLSHAHNVDSAATQILFLRSLHHHGEIQIPARVPKGQRERVHSILERVRLLTERYPDITR